MVFKIGILLVLLLIIGLLEEIRSSIEKLTNIVVILKTQEEHKNDNKNTDTMQKQKE